MVFDKKYSIVLPKAEHIETGTIREFTSQQILNMKTPKQKTPAKKPTGKGTNMENAIAKAPKVAFPKTIKPMLATLVDKPIEAQGWLYEVKWDGYRSLGYEQGKNKS